MNESTIIYALRYENTHIYFKTFSDKITLLFHNAKFHKHRMMFSISWDYIWYTGDNSSITESSDLHTPLTG